MKLGNGADQPLDVIDLQILEMQQQDCKLSLARIGERVGLSAPSVNERIKKLEQAGVIRGYHAQVDSRRVGLDVTAFIGVVIEHARGIGDFEIVVSEFEGVLECHHVTGQHTLLLKVKTSSTSSLEQLISQIRGIPGVARTETMVVLSTYTEHTQLSLGSGMASADRPAPRRRVSRTASAQGTRMEVV